MNAPTPGWHPDPTGRHEYRYWNGAGWTDDVSDNGVTAVDPVGSGGEATAIADQTVQADPTRQYAPQGPAGPQAPPQPGQMGAPGLSQPYPSGQVPPAQPGRSGPSTGLVVGIAALAVALIAGLVFALTRDDGDDTAGDDTETIADDSTDDSTTSDSIEDALGDLDVEGGDIGSGDGVVELIAQGMEMEAGGAITHEQAMCAAQAIVDHFGLENLMEMSTTGGDPFAGATAEDQAALVELMTDCIPAEVLIDIGMSSGG